MDPCFERRYVCGECQATLMYAYGGHVNVNGYGDGMRCMPTHSHPNGQAHVYAANVTPNGHNATNGWAGAAAGDTGHVQFPLRRTPPVARHCNPINRALPPSTRPLVSPPVAQPCDPTNRALPPSTKPPLSSLPLARPFDPINRALPPTTSLTVAQLCDATNCALSPCASPPLSPHSALKPSLPAASESVTSPLTKPASSRQLASSDLDADPLQKSAMADQSARLHTAMTALDELSAAAAQQDWLHPPPEAMAAECKAQAPTWQPHVWAQQHGNDGSRANGAAAAAAAECAAAAAAARKAAVVKGREAPPAPASLPVKRAASTINVPEAAYKRCRPWQPGDSAITSLLQRSSAPVSVFGPQAGSKEQQPLRPTAQYPPHNGSSALLQALYPEGLPATFRQPEQMQQVAQLPGDYGAGQPINRVVTTQQPQPPASTPSHPGAAQVISGGFKKKKKQAPPKKPSRGTFRPLPVDLLLMATSATNCSGAPGQMKNQQNPGTPLHLCDDNPAWISEETWFACQVV